MSRAGRKRGQRAQHAPSPSGGSLCDYRCTGPFAARIELVTCTRCLGWPELLRQAFPAARARHVVSGSHLRAIVGRGVFPVRRAYELARIHESHGWSL